MPALLSILAMLRTEPEGTWALRSVTKAGWKDAGALMTLEPGAAQAGENKMAAVRPDIASGHAVLGLVWAASVAS